MGADERTYTYATDHDRGDQSWLLTNQLHTSVMKTRSLVRVKGLSPTSAWPCLPWSRSDRSLCRLPHSCLWCEVTLTSDPWARHHSARSGKVCGCPDRAQSRLPGALMVLPESYTSVLDRAEPKQRPEARLAMRSRPDRLRAWSDLNLAVSWSRGELY